MKETQGEYRSGLNHYLNGGPENADTWFTGMWELMEIPS